MKRIGIISAVLVLLAIPVSAFQAPREIGGIVLGGPVAECKDKLILETTVALRNLYTAKQVEFVPGNGFAKGSLWYSTCAGTPKVIRIKLKYDDSSKRFFQALLKKYIQRFGDPEWKGDPFHMVTAWKWKFTDNKGQSIRMILQHNVKNPDETIGNSVKLTLWDLYEKEKECFQKQQKRLVRKKQQKKQQGPSVEPDWHLLLPR